MSDLTAAYIAALTGSVDTICDWRIINDRDRGDQGINLRGSLAQSLPTLQQYNAAGYGIFVCINEMKPEGRRTLENVQAIRTHVVDIDNVFTADDSYKRAVSSQFPPHMAVQSSQGKYHLYWLVEPYQGNDFYRLQQRKLQQLYDGDQGVVDATRVLRVPGFYHCKGEPQMVTCWGIHSQPKYTAEQIAGHLTGINVIEHISNRFPLGEPSKAAPSLEWLIFALENLCDPDMRRDERMPLCAAFKQAGWTLADDQKLLEIWLSWSRRKTREEHDEKANIKMWHSIDSSDVGWSRFERLTHVRAYISNYNSPPELPALTFPEDQVTPQLADVLDITGKKLWFKGCHFVTSRGKIFTPQACFMDSTQFNGAYGGKEFCLKAAGGKVTDEPWKAALRSTDWQIPKVHHTRFLPTEEPGSTTMDELGRAGLNIYVPPIVKAVSGSIDPWLSFLHKILPTPEDVVIFDNYLAHCIKYPGHKIPWGVLLQSAQGIGKQMIGAVVKYCVGETYTYEPKAEELVSGASRFNAWMKEKTFILVDEIRVGDRRDLLEGLKKIITDKRIAVEGKGVDQKMEDNPSNWLFFSNYKDAIPINENERRYCVFYSNLSNARAIASAGMNKDFFDDMYRWLEHQGGFEALAYYYLNHHVICGSLPHRAPKTSSYDEVIKIGRSPLEVVLDERIQSNERGFRGGYISWPMLMKAIEASPMRSKPPEFAIEQALETKGYKALGYTATPLAGEDMKRPSLIYVLDDVAGLSVQGYEIAQVS